MGFFSGDLQGAHGKKRPGDRSLGSSGEHREIVRRWPGTPTLVLVGSRRQGDGVGGARAGGAITEMGFPSAESVM
jgi:hypothetical protein